MENIRIYIFVQGKIRAIMIAQNYCYTLEQSFKEFFNWIPICPQTRSHFPKAQKLHPVKDWPQISVISRPEAWD